MSLFDYPRINFRGKIELNPGTANNDDYAQQPGAALLPASYDSGDTIPISVSRVWCPRNSIPISVSRVWCPRNSLSPELLPISESVCVPGTLHRVRMIAFVSADLQGPWGQV